MQVVVEVPECVAPTMSPEALGQRIKLYAALLMYRAGELSVGAACELADVDRYTFLDKYKRIGIETLQVGSEDLAAELAAAGATAHPELVDNFHEAFWSIARDDFERLRADADAWQAERDEIAAWDAALGDGLDPADEA